MATWSDGRGDKLVIITRGDITKVRIAPDNDLIRESKEIRIPLKTLKETVNAQ